MIAAGVARDLIRIEGLRQRYGRGDTVADEPTAPLDSERALAVIRMLKRMARQIQTAVILVTHDEKIMPTFQRIDHIRDGDA